jgi:hypothetical protein
MKTLKPIVPGNSSAAPRPFRIRPVPRLPREQRDAALPSLGYTQAAAALRQKTLALALQAMEASSSLDAKRFEQLMAEAGSFNLAAAWLASQAYPAGLQANDPLIA